MSVSSESTIVNDLPPKSFRKSTVRVALVHPNNLDPWAALKSGLSALLSVLSLAWYSYGNTRNDTCM
jgi:hypothetical protein